MTVHHRVPKLFGQGINLNSNYSDVSKNGSGKNYSKIKQLQNFYTDNLPPVIIKYTYDFSSLFLSYLYSVKLSSQALSSVSISLTALSLNILAGSIRLTSRVDMVGMERNSEEQMTKFFVKARGANFFVIETLSQVPVVRVPQFRKCWYAQNMINKGVYLLTDSACTRS
jgi:hypothetical protein